jgi:hypothetical protein
VISFGWLSLLVATMVIGTRHPGVNTTANKPSLAWTALPFDPSENAKAGAVILAKRVVPEVMKDPDSAQFGQVWGVGVETACGLVNGKNSFGAMTGQQRFIFQRGQTEFETQSEHFAKHWNSICVERLSSQPPSGVLGRRWGSKPTSDLKRVAPPTEDGLALYIPIGSQKPLEGVPVNESDFQFDHLKLYEADFFIDGEKPANTIKNALVEKYGIPSDYDNAAHRYKWRWVSRKFAISMIYNNKTNRASISYIAGKP